jgi:hypothetical protein
MKPESRNLQKISKVTQIHMCKWNVNETSNRHEIKVDLESNVIIIDFGMNELNE